MLKDCLLACLFAVPMQIAFSQDYDFEQTDDLHKLVVMEAENFSSNTPNADYSWVLTDSPINFSGQGAMMAVAGAGGALTVKEDILAKSAILSYKINFIKAGLHYIWARASRTGGGDDSYHAGIDGGITDSSMFLTFHKTTLKGEWVWIFYRNTLGPANLDIPSKGVHELNIYIRENGFKIDKILLTDDDTNSYKPEGMGPDETLALSAVPDFSPDQSVVSFFPNPVDQQMNIQINDDQYTNGTMKIVDLQGRLIRHIAFDNGMNKVADVSDLEPGLYFMKFEHNNRLITVGRFLKK